MRIQLQLLIAILLLSVQSRSLCAYTPQGDSRVVFWLDSSDPGTLFQDSAATLPVAAQDDPVGAWLDKSPSGWRVTSTAGDSARPRFRSNIQNARPSVRFDGINDSLTAANASLQNSAYTIFVVARRVSAKPFEALLSLHSGGVDWDSPASLCVGYSDGTILADAREYALLSVVANGGNGAAFLYTTKYDGVANTAYMNGVSGGAVPSAGSFSSETITLGARGASLQDFNNYDYFEVLIFSAALSNSDRAEVENYLGSKYAFPNSQWAPPPPPPPTPPSGSYNPAADTNVTFWLDSSDVGTIFQDTGLSNPVTGNGQLVGGWLDKSKNGWHVIAGADGNSKPVYRVSQQNGKPSVRFDGTSDFLRTTAASLGSGQLSIVAVARRISHRPMESIVSIHDDGSLDWDNAASVCAGYSDEFLLADSRNSALLSQADHPGSGVSFMYSSVYDSAVNDAFINGVPSAPVPSTGNFSAEVITLGARSANLQDFNNYEYFEVLIFDFALPSGYRQAVEAYLGQKYALPGTQWAPPPPPPPVPPEGPYAPAVDSHVAFWLDASDTNTLFQDVNRTVPVTAENQLVASWADKSLNGWHVSAPAETNKPTFKLNRQSGFPAVRFDGNSDALRTLSASLQGSAFTVFVVGRRMSHRPFESILSIYDETSLDWNNGSSVCVGYSDGSLLADCRRSALVSQKSHPGSGVSFLYTTKYDGTSNTSYVNGIAGTPVLSRGNFSAEAIALGARSVHLADFNNYEYFEVLVLDFAASDAYRAAVEEYLGSKYGLPGTQWEPPPPPPPQPPVGPYSPNSDPHLAFWLDAADTSTLFQDTARANPVTSGEQPVGAWADKSVNGWHLSAPLGPDSRPSFKASQQNGIGGVRFDGTSDALRTISAGLQGSSYTIFVVSKRISYRNFEALLSIHDENSPDWNNLSSVCVGYSDGKHLADVRQNQLKSQTSHPSAGVAFIYASKFDGTNSTSYVNQNQGSQVSATGSFDAERIVLGARGPELTDKNNYEYYEVLIYDFAMSDAYRQAVEAYLISKYSIENVGSVPPIPGPELPPQPPGIYTPAGDNRVIFWVDATDPATLFQNAQGTIPVAADSQYVGRWLDKSSKGWHITTDSGLDGNKPTFKMNQLAGKPAIRFDGSADYLRTTAASLQGKAYTVFVVSRRIAFTDLETLVSIYDAGGQDWDNNYSVCLGHNVFFGEYQNFMGDCRNDILMSETAHPGDDIPFIFGSKYDGSYNTTYINGNAGVPYPSAGNFSAEAIMLGARSASLDHFNQYDYFEVLIYDFALSDAYRNAVEMYLKNKYALE
jgi:hypothetical protein